jgi:hypothetical protein
VPAYTKHASQHCGRCAERRACGLPLSSPAHCAPRSIVACCVACWTLFGASVLLYCNHSVPSVVRCLLHGCMIFVAITGLRYWHRAPGLCFCVGCLIDDVLHRGTLHRCRVGLAAAVGCDLRRLLSCRGTPACARTRCRTEPMPFPSGPFLGSEASRVSPGRWLRLQISPPFVRARTRTCAAAIGQNFAAGTEDGRSPVRERTRCILPALKQ